MTRRRRRFFRDDLLAPWISLVVIGGLWALGASLLGGPKPVLSGAAARGTPKAVEAAAAERRGTAGSSGTLTPPRADAPAANTDATAARAETPVDDPPEAAPVMDAGGDIGELLRKRLLVPVSGIEPSKLVSTFNDTRGGARRHEAMDILAPRGTPVVATGDGRIVKLFTSAAGGLTIYQFDPEEHFSYYYAHLDRYAADVKEGDEVLRGQTIGYVGTTGNAPPGTPHLHFAIFKLASDKKWWEGLPLDPFDVLR